MAFAGRVLLGVANGVAIRLTPGEETKTGRLGLAEGIETAIAATNLFGVPTWSVVSLPNLAAVRLPFGVSQVVIFADADDGGAAGELLERAARRLVELGRTVKVWEVRPEIAAGRGADVANAVAVVRGLG